MRFSTTSFPQREAVASSLSLSFLLWVITLTPLLEMWCYSINSHPFIAHAFTERCNHEIHAYLQLHTWHYILRSIYICTATCSVRRLVWCVKTSYYYSAVDITAEGQCTTYFAKREIEAMQIIFTCCVVASYYLCLLFLVPMQRPLSRDQTDCSPQSRLRTVATTTATATPRQVRTTRSSWAQGRTVSGIKYEYVLSNFWRSLTVFLHQVRWHCPEIYLVPRRNIEANGEDWVQRRTRWTWAEVETRTTRWPIMVRALHLSPVKPVGILKWTMVSLCHPPSSNLFKNPRVWFHAAHY